MPRFDQHQYESLWCQQLIREFEDICWQRKLNLPLPSIEIFSARHRLGEWRENSRTLRLSRELITTRPWPVTINVLKHEMAHQLCGAWGHPEAGHGPTFNEACIRLGVPPAYRTARGDSPELFTDLESESQLVKEGRRFFAKVEKLLALAQSSNEHEAALAMQKANELIARHNLKLSAEHAERRYTRVVIDTGRQRIHGWQRSIAAILRDHFFVKVIQAETFIPLLSRRHKTFELFGLTENVAVAEHCYHFLLARLDSLWRLNRPRFKCRTITEKNSYYLGVVTGFAQKLNAQDRKQASRSAETTSALVVAADQRLNEFIAMSFPRLRTIRKAGPRINRHTFLLGAADGKEIVLSRGVPGNDGNLGRLLGNGATGARTSRTP